MSKFLTGLKALVCAVAALICGGAWASQLYVDKLDAGTERIPNGTYGEGIVVPGYGIKATTYAQTTQIGDSNSSIKNVFGNSLSVVTHTVSGWFKVDALPASGNKTIYAAISHTGDYGGYKLAVDNTGKLIVGRINGNNYNFHNNGTEYVTMANTALVANQWYYITVAVSWANSNVMTPTVYVNGESCAVSGTPATFTGGLNGGTFKHFDIGAGVSAAGLYADNTAITDASVIKSLAVSSNNVSIIHLAQLVNKADGTVETTYDAIESSITINEGKELQIVAPLDGSVMDFSSSVSGAGDLRFVGIPEQRTLTDQLTGTATAYDVLNNVSVDAIIPRSAILTGGSITGGRQEATIHNVKRGNGSLTFCAHTIDGSYLKVVKVEMTQDGANVKAKRVWGHYVSSSSVPKETDWCSFTGSDNTGYQIKEIVFDVVGGVNLAATSANNTSFTGKTIIDNCFVKTSVPGSLSDTVQVINGGELSVANGTGTGGSYNNAGYGITYEAQTGSRITFADQNFVVGYNDTLFANGGTIEYIANSWGGKNMYVGNLKLAEGGVIAGGGLIRLGNYVNSSVIATGNSLICNAQIQPYSAGSTRKTVTFDVDEAALLTVYTSVAKPADNGYDNVDLKKTGAGTIYFKRCQTNTANTEPMTISGGVVKGDYDTFCSTITVEEGGAYSISAATSKTISGAGEIWMTANNLSFASATLTSFTGHIVIKSGVTYTCAPSALPAKLKIEPNGTWAYTHEGKSVTIAATDATKSLYYENGAIKIVNAEVTSVDVTKFLYPGISSVDVSGCTALAEVYVGSSGDFSAEFAKVTGVGNDVTIVVVETPAEYANGALTINNVPEEMVSRIKVKRPGLAELVTPIAGPEANTLTINDSTIKISGAATSFDVTFNTKDTGKLNGHIDYQCLDYVRLQYDSVPSYINETTTPGSKTMGVYLKHHPYVHNLENNNDAWFKSTDEITLAVVGQMPSTQNTVFLHMGRSGTKNGLFLATGEADEEVKICYNKKWDVVVIDTLKVPNASSARHTYVITKHDDPEGTENRQTTFEIWLDGELINTKKFDHFIVTGGIQVGKPYGDSFSGWNNVGDSDSTSYINLIRVYDRVISEAEILKYSDSAEYPYNSPQGTYQRNFTTDAGQMWKGADNAWTSSVEGEESGVALPLKGLVTANFAGATTITVNQTEATSYEKLILNGASDGDSTITFEKGEGAVAQISTLNTTINTPVIIKEGTLDLSGGPTKISAHGHVTFDYSSLTAQDVLTDDDGAASFKVTGLTQATADQFTLIKPTDARLDVSLVKHNDNNSYYVEATVKPVYLNNDNTFKLSDGTAVATLLDGDKVIVSSVGYDGNQRWQVNLNNAALTGHTVVIDYPNGGTNPGVTIYSDIYDGVDIEILEGSKMYMTSNKSVWATSISGDGTFSLGNTLYLHKTLTITCDAETTGSGNFCLESESVLNVPAESTVKVTAYSGHQGYVKKTTAANVDTYTFVAGTQEIAPSEDDEPVVVEDVGTGIIVNPGADVIVPTTADTSKIAVKYTIPGTGTVKDLKADGLVTVAVNQETGALELTTTDAAKPEETAIAMSTPTVEEEDQVQFTITNPIPGLFYAVSSCDTPDGTFESATGDQATSDAAKTVSIPMTFTDGKKVKYYKVSVKATK